jgi:HEAT repeat protein
LTRTGIILTYIIFIIIIQGCSKRYVAEDEERKAVEVISQSYKSENWQTRKEAVTNVCLFNSPRAEDLLIAALDDVHPIVKIEALNCIGIKKSNKAKRNIRQIAEFESNDNVRMYAIQTLAKYGDPTSAPIFAKGLASDDWLIREESIKGLLIIDDVFIKRTSIPYIIQALNDSRINVRLATLENLKIQNKVIYNELTVIINNEDNYYKINLLNAAIKAINGYLLDKSTRERLISFLTHPNTETRLFSLRVLKRDKELQDDE